ncbi:hypothetical protein Leryth_001605 [Lithospermum erythrorhizon]|nr:hypothetical protein Leryth_001605 [Lithospermum erythrorhizon]
MSNLIEKRRSDLVVLCLKNLSDISVYELMCVLKYFLAMPKDGIRSMGDVRKEWESQALLAIEKHLFIGSASEFHEEIEPLSVVTTLAAEANLCASIANLTNTLRSTRAESFLEKLQSSFMLYSD